MLSLVTESVNKTNVIQELPEKRAILPGGNDADAPVIPREYPKASDAEPCPKKVGVPNFPTFSLMLFGSKPVTLKVAKVHKADNGWSYIDYEARAREDWT